ncbi:MAG: RimK family alpha-L-glutamate ligase [Woeseiaceae bacterium]
MTQRRIVFLSQNNMDGYVCDDDEAFGAFAAKGLDVSVISWCADEDWSAFDGVIVRSTWDYQRHADAFFSVLGDIESHTRLANDLSLMQWNMDKVYLQSMQAAGIPIVPTVFGNGMDASKLAALLAEADSECVIKPTISAGAERTFRVPVAADDAVKRSVIDGHANSAWMWQPFLSQIVEEGEYSLFYFNGVFSHAILKKPQPGDFRVQEEFGGVITSVTPSETMRSAADAVMGYLDAAPLYARVDLVRGESDWMLIELELIEPSLYLRQDKGASDRFAEATRQFLSAT